MKSQNTKSSDELRREVQNQINTIDNDITQIQSRLTPGQLIDHALFSRADLSIAQKFTYLKNNPVGTAFLSLGTLMLMEGEANQTYEAQAKEKLSSLKSAVKSQMPHKQVGPDMVPNTADRAIGKVHDLKNKVMDMKNGLTSKVSEVKTSATEMKSEIQSTAGQIKDGITTGVDAIKENIDTFTANAGSTTSSPSDFENWRSSVDDEGIKQKMKDTLSSGREKMSSFYSTGMDKVHNLEPMTFMVLGLGLGAATGAALPIPEKEQQFVESHLSDRMGDFNTDMRKAIQECSDVLKDLVLNDVKNFSFKSA